MALQTLQEPVTWRGPLVTTKREHHAELRIMNKPPRVLDGAKVLWWAWAGDTPFGELYGAQGDDRLIYGFAVCQYENGQIYRFTCNKHWEVVQDSDHQSAGAAKSAIPLNYDASRVKWIAYKE